MNEQPLDLDAISTLTAALCDGTLDGEGFARLEQFLADNPAARRWYIDYVDLHDELLANQFGGVQDEAGFPHGRSRARNKSAGKMTARRSPASVLAAGEPRPSPGAQGRATLLSGGSVPAVASPSFILHPSAFLDSPLLSYLVAILVFVGGIVGAWAWRLPDAGETQTGAAGQVLTVNSREVTAPGATGNSPREAGIPPPGTVVGRIMAAVDCRWADPGAAGHGRRGGSLGSQICLGLGHPRDSLPERTGRHPSGPGRLRGGLGSRRPALAGQVDRPGRAAVGPERGFRLPRTTQFWDRARGSRGVGRRSEIRDGRQGRDSGL